MKRLARCFYLRDRWKEYRRASVWRPEVAVRLAGVPSVVHRGFDAAIRCLTTIASGAAAGATFFAAGGAAAAAGGAVGGGSSAATALNTSCCTSVPVFSVMLRGRLGLPKHKPMVIFRMGYAIETRPHAPRQDPGRLIEFAG